MQHEEVFEFLMVFRNENFKKILRILLFYTEWNIERTYKINTLYPDIAYNIYSIELFNTQVKHLPEYCYI